MHLLLTMPKQNEKLQIDFKEIYLEFNDLVRSVGYRMIGPTHLDDLVQDVFMKVWKNLSQFKNQSSLKTWIYRITLNTCYDFLKKKSIKTTHQLQETASTNSSVGTAEAINKALFQLSPSHRSAIVLICYEGLSLEEAAQVEKTNTGTMKSRAFNAKKQMKELLKQYGVYHA